MATPSDDVVERARGLAPRIAACADEIERLRRLPDALVRALHDAGLFWLLLPRSLGGAELDPPTFVRATEALAREDASTAWVICQTGLRGTGSDSFTVTDLFVPRAHSIARDDPAERRSAARSTASRRAASTPPASPAWPWGSRAACSRTSSRWRATRHRAATAGRRARAPSPSPGWRGPGPSATRPASTCCRRWPRSGATSASAACWTWSSARHPPGRVPRDPAGARGR